MEAWEVMLSPIAIVYPREAAVITSTTTPGGMTRLVLLRFKYGLGRIQSFEEGVSAPDSNVSEGGE